MEKTKTRLCIDEPVASVKGKLEALKRQTTCGGEAWAKTWRRWTKATVKSKWSWDRLTNKVIWSVQKKSHMIIWSGSYHSRKVKINIDSWWWSKAWWRLVLVWHQHLRRWNGMCKAKVWFVGHFISPIEGCVEKCMTIFRIDDHTIKRGKLVCISIIECHLSKQTLHMFLGSSNVENHSKMIWKC